MSIRVVCPNGHALQVKSELAGKTGLCPICKVRIQIPAPHPEGFSEDSIMGLLGGGFSPPVKAAPQHDKAASAGSWGTEQRETQKPPKKGCSKCKQEVPTGTTICPHCHTFIGNLSDS